MRNRLLPSLVCAALFGAGCGSDAHDTSGVANGLLITLDTTRMDAPSWYGYTPDVTPELDRLAAEGVSYTNARTTVPLTLPAHTSMLTGLYPPRHTVRVNGKRPLPSAATTLAETASEAGFETAAFLAAVVLAPEFGLNQGFTTYDLPQRGNLATSFYDERPAAAVVDATLAWLRARNTDRPFFLWVHLFDPHEPYEAPEAHRIGEDRSLAYLGEVGYASHELGRLFDALRADGTLDHTFVTVLADHGEGLGEKGEATHGDFCNDSTLRIPFLLRYPDGFAAGTTSDAVVSAVDVAPTMAEAMGLAMPGDLDGQSLFRRDVASDRGVYFESYGAWTAYDWSPITGWVDRGGKYLHSSRPRFFDVTQDPNEEHDRIADVDVTPYRNALRALATRESLDQVATSAIDDELRARLMNLGYAGMDATDRELPAIDAQLSLPDPMESMPLHALLMQGYSMLNGGYYPQATEAFQQVLARDPDNPFVLDHLGTSLIREARFAEAVPVLQRLLGQGRRKAGTWFNLGVSLVRLNRPQEARTAFQEAALLAPDEPRIRQYLDQLGG